MAYTNFIAAIDLGTSHITGIVGMKTDAGTLTIIACETENSANSIRRGCIYNVEKTAVIVKNLIQKLESKLPGNRIGKVFVGVGGQSIRSVEHTVSKKLKTGSIVTNDVIDMLHRECLAYRPDMLEVLSHVQPAYYLDGKFEPNPVGVPCTQIEAKYKLIVARPSLRQYIYDSISKRVRVEIAGIIVSPLALSEMVLSEHEKDMGCALIGFGAGVTSLTVYKSGQLVNLCVIPLGGNLITRDICSLGIVEPDAEEIKKTYGSALVDKDDDSTIQVNTADRSGLRSIRISELNTIVEARMQEILENVYARLEATGMKESLRAGIVITGGASRLNGLVNVINDGTGLNIRSATLPKGIIERMNIPDMNPDMDAVALLLNGNQNCAVYTAPRPEPVVVSKPITPKPEPVPVSDPEEEVVTDEKEEEKKEPVKTKRRFLDKLAGFAGDLFNEDN